MSLARRKGELRWYARGVRRSVGKAINAAALRTQRKAKELIQRKRRKPEDTEKDLRSDNSSVVGLLGPQIGVIPNSAPKRRQRLPGPAKRDRPLQIHKQQPSTAHAS
jgi:hypothetical protein